MTTNATQDVCYRVWVTRLATDPYRATDPAIFSGTYADEAAAITELQRLTVRGYEAWVETVKR